MVTTMTKSSRVLTAVAAVLLLSVFAFPLWSIHLTAPQYPEGIGMYIRVNTITGWTEFDLTKINNLNKYIGMRPIVPEAIPELRVMPWLFGALTVLGLAAAASGRRRALHGWLIAFGLLGVLGLADFYRWAYDYGHNLDAETAIIKVPGMSYQPPLIGTKQLLNFTASSWPALGGWLAGLSFLLGVAAAWRSAGAGRRRRRNAVVAAAAAAAACGGPARQPLADEHAHHTHAEATALASEAAPAPSSRASEAPPAPSSRASEASVGIYCAPRVADSAHRSTGSRQTLHACGMTYVVVSPAGPIASLAEAIRRAAPGAHIVVRPGTYREPTILVDKPLTIVGDGWPVIDGEMKREIMVVTANAVTVRGLVLRDVGKSFRDDNAAIKVVRASGCAIDGNRIENAFFGIYLAGVTDCRVAGNVIRAAGGTEPTSGNGIHLWSSADVTVDRNLVSGHRDGIYLEFARNVVVERNTSEANLRYGLHFMYSDSCRYVANVFRRNLGGVAVMYARRVDMIGNRFEDNWGGAAYGLLLKEISDPRIERNEFNRNTVGLVADGAVRIIATQNAFARNGWAVKLLGSTYDGRIEHNDFVANTFDVAANGDGGNLLAGNYFDSYQGYDLDRDGFGDVPHHPVRLFSVVVERNPPAIILLRSFFVDLLDVAERVLPSLTPATLADARPAIRRVAGVAP
jgi:nitrous oxidase accessory protein